MKKRWSKIQSRDVIYDPYLGEKEQQTKQAKSSKWQPNLYFFNVNV